MVNLRLQAAGMVNFGMVNEAAFLYLHAAKITIFRVFTRKCAIQKVH
jgi:hypothetical protein